MTAESRFRFNLFFLTATLAVFATGLVMLLEFHVGHGARARAFAGVPRDAWRQLHLVSGITFLLRIGTHLGSHRNYIQNVLKRPVHGRGNALRRRVCL
jgi:hypothetical protein